MAYICRNDLSNWFLSGLLAGGILGSSQAVAATSRDEDQQLMSEDDRLLGLYSSNGFYGEAVRSAEGFRVALYISATALSKIYHSDIGDPFLLDSASRSQLKRQALDYFAEVFSLAVDGQKVQMANQASFLNNYGVLPHDKHTPSQWGGMLRIEFIALELPKDSWSFGFDLNRTEFKSLPVKITDGEQVAIVEFGPKLVVFTSKNLKEKKMVKPEPRQTNKHKNKASI